MIQFIILALFVFFVEGFSLCAQANDQQKKQGGFPEEVLSLRDPFKRLVHQVDQDTGPVLTELEKVPLSNIKLLGVITGGKEVRAMVSPPNGMTYTVSENTLIGNRSGIIVKITSKGIRVKERFINLQGDEDFNITDIKLPSAIKITDLTGSRKGELTPLRVQTKNNVSQTQVENVNPAASDSAAGMNLGTASQISQQVGQAVQGMKGYAEKVEAAVGQE